MIEGLIWLIATFIRDNKEFVAVVAGFVGTYFTIRRQTRVFQTYVALEFFKRYAEISNGMPDKLRLAKYESTQAPASDNEWKQIMRCMIQYGNLCSEEFALWRLGRVPKEVWGIWASGIKENFETALWREAWQRVEREYQSYVEFAAFMNGMVAAGKAAEDRQKAASR